MPNSVFEAIYLSAGEAKKKRTAEDEVRELIRRLNNGSEEFCKSAKLFGSRDMLYEHEMTAETDWDIAVQQSWLFGEQLIMEGWEEKLDEKEGDLYRDEMSEQVFEKTLPLGAKVQIVFKSDLKAFKTVWNSIPSSLYRKFLHKKSPQYIGKDAVRRYFDSMYSVYEMGKVAGSHGALKPSNVTSAPVEAPEPAAGWAAVPEDFFAAPENRVVQAEPNRQRQLMLLNAGEADF